MRIAAKVSEAFGFGRGGVQAAKDFQRQPERRRKPTGRRNPFDDDFDTDAKNLAAAVWLELLGGALFEGDCKLDAAWKAVSEEQRRSEERRVGEGGRARWAAAS